MRKTILLSFAIFLCCNIIIAQPPTKDIDPKWDKYYQDNPSRVYEHYQATDFIEIIDKVGFAPVSKLFEKKVSLLKRLLLASSRNELEVLSSEGWYQSRTYKHDDYFNLYNITYKKVTKETWDTYCPYLIPLMNLDGTINLK